MSAILNELMKACGLSAVDHTNPAEMDKLLDKVADLSNEAWEGLSIPAQDWYNACADAIEANAELPPLPDLQEATTTRRAARRGAAAPAAQEAVGGSDILKVGQKVNITNKRGKVIEGLVVELTDEDVVLDNGDECSLDKITTVRVLEDVSGGAASNNEPEGPAEPQVGDTVSLTTKRGKVVEGVVEELTDDDIVLAGGDEYARDKITDLKVVKSAAKPAAKTTRSAKETPAEPEEKKRSSNPKGVSVGGRIRELMCADIKITPEAVSKVLVKEGIEFRETSLNMIYKDTKAVIELLIKNGFKK